MSGVSVEPSRSSSASSGPGKAHGRSASPSNPQARTWYDNPQAPVHSLRNSSIQGGFFIMAARAVGLDCGPMSGFDTAKVDAAFFAGTKIRSNFLVNLGRGDPASVHPRAPRLGFDEACRIE